MNSEANPVKVDSHCFRFTGEYRAGLLVGFGAGIVIMTIVMKHAAVRPYEDVFVFGGMALALLGAAIAQRLQQKHAVERNERDK